MPMGGRWSLLRVPAVVASMVLAGGGLTPGIVHAQSVDLEAVAIAFRLGGERVSIAQKAGVTGVTPHLQTNTNVSERYDVLVERTEPVTADAEIKEGTGN